MKQTGLNGKAILQAYFHHMIRHLTKPYLLTSSLAFKKENCFN